MSRGIAQSLQSPHCAPLMSWSLQLHTGKLRLIRVRSRAWDTQLDLNSGLSDSKIQRDPHCLLWVEVGQDKTKAYFSLVLPLGNVTLHPCWYDVILPCPPTGVRRLMEMPVGVPMPRANPPSGSDLCGCRAACAGMMLMVCFL